MGDTTATTAAETLADTSISETTVTAIIPFCETYTPRTMLEEAIESVEQQVDVDTEVLVVEDEDERGPAWARNVGLDQADTRYVAFLDADDTWYDTKLVDQLRQMRETGAGLCVDGDQQYSPLEFVGALMRSDIFGLTSAIVVDTHQVSTRFEESLERREDHLYMMEAATEGGVCFVPQTFLDRTHEQGFSKHVSLSPEQIAEFFELVTDRVPQAARFRRPYYQNEYVYLGRSKHYDGEYRTAITHFVRSLSYGISIQALGAIALTVLAALYAYLVDPIQRRLVRSSHN